MRIEQQKIAKPKPLPISKRTAMAEKYIKSRLQLDPVMQTVSKFLFEQNLKDTVWYNFYMHFARECFAKITKYYQTDPLLLLKYLASITQKWHQ